MKKSEMEIGTTYIICPDRKCKLFWDTSRWCPCDGDCPHEDKLKLVIICHGCGKMIILPGDHCSWCRIDHNCSGKGGGCCSNFRMDNKYHLLYKMPTSGGDRK